jgi:hypothetical protein
VTPDRAALETASRPAAAPPDNRPNSGRRSLAPARAPAGRPPLLVKRDDAIPFGFGGNKIRKLQLVAAQALAEGPTR